MDFNPSFYFDANPDTFHFVADPDPDPARDANLQSWAQSPLKR